MILRHCRRRAQREQQRRHGDLAGTPHTLVRNSGHCPLLMSLELPWHARAAAPIRLLCEFRQINSSPSGVSMKCSWPDSTRRNMVRALTPRITAASRACTIFRNALHPSHQASAPFFRRITRSRSLSIVIFRLVPIHVPLRAGRTNVVSGRKQPVPEAVDCPCKPADYWPAGKWKSSTSCKLVLNRALIRL